MTNSGIRLLHPGYSTAAFAVTVAYVPWFADAASAPRWMLLSLLVPMFVRIPAMRPAHILGTLFLTWAALSMLWTPVMVEALQPLWRLALLAGLFCIAFEMESLEDIFIGAGFGMACASWVAIAQYIGAGAEPTGLFLNKNFMAEAAVLVLIGLAVYRQFMLAACALPAALLPQARGAMLALAVVAVLALWRHHSRWLAGLLVFALLIAVQFMGLNGKSFGERWVIWSYTAQHLTLLGHGLGSFYIDFPSFGDFARRFDHAHNDFLEVAYELGAIGLLLFTALLLGAMRYAGKGIRYVLAAFIVEACFGFPFALPVTGAVAALCVGHLWGLRYHVRSAVPGRERPLRPGPRLIRVPSGDGTLATRRGDLST